MRSLCVVVCTGVCARRANDVENANMQTSTDNVLQTRRLFIFVAKAEVQEKRSNFVSCGPGRFLHSARSLLNADKCHPSIMDRAFQDGGEMLLHQDTDFDRSSAHQSLQIVEVKRR